MMVAHANGHSSNGHNKRKPEQLKLELPEAEPPKPCALRLGYGSWCFKPDGHEGEHEGPPPVYGPLEVRPRLWRDHKGRSR